MSIEVMKQALEALEFAGDLIAPITENCQCQICLAHTALRQAIAEAEQPDLAGVGEVGVWGDRREWVGLTDEDIDLYGLDEGVTDNKAPAWLVTYARGIEAKLKEKNVPQP
jgi:hypothetical protein